MGGGQFSNVIIDLRYMTPVDADTDADADTYARCGYIPLIFNIVPILTVWIIDPFCPIEKKKGYGIKTLHVNQT